jgi:uncharacterized OsmC-like protein
MADKRVAVSARMGADFTVRADIRGHQMAIDQPQAAGGNNEGPTPLEAFLFALAGCVASIARIAAMQQRIELRGMEVSVEADYNPNGLLGKPSEDRIGFKSVQIAASIDADMDDNEKKAFLDAVCARCPLHDNIHYETHVTHHLLES